MSIRDKIWRVNARHGPIYLSNTAKILRRPSKSGLEYRKRFRFWWLPAILTGVRHLKFLPGSRSIGKFGKHILKNSYRMLVKSLPCFQYIKYWFPQTHCSFSLCKSKISTIIHVLRKDFFFFFLTKSPSSK